MVGGVDKILAASALPALEPTAVRLIASDDNFIPGTEVPGFYLEALCASSGFGKFALLAIPGLKGETWSTRRGVSRSAGKADVCSIKKLSKRVNNLHPNLAEDHFQKMIDWHARSIAQRVPFVERYRQGSASFTSTMGSSSPA